MSNPNDDTGVPSGLNDDAEMERTPSRTSETVMGHKLVCIIMLLLARHSCDERGEGNAVSPGLGFQ